MHDETRRTAVLDAPPPAPPPSAGLARRLAHALPPLLVFTALAGLLAWGHLTGWSVPKFSALASGRTTLPDAWCPEHSVPEAACVECNPDLMPRRKPFGWCKVHGVHE